MRFPGLVTLNLLLCPIAFSQTAVNNAVPSAPREQAPATQTSQPPSYANYSIMLVGPPGGSAIVLMHNPKNELEFVEVGKTQQALSAGYVPVRAVELGEFISSLKEENAQLSVENTRLKLKVQADQAVSAPTSSTPSQAELEAQRRGQIEAEKADRRQRMIQGWLTLRAITPPTQPYQLPPPVNPNANRLQTNCTTRTVGNTNYTDCH